MFRADGGEPHHRIFGYLKVESITHLLACAARDRDALASYRHTHALTPYGSNDAIYRGRGRTAVNDDPRLRLTVPGGPVSLWQVPRWLCETGLSYHDRPERWLPGPKLKSVGRGQEFVADIGKRRAPRNWLKQVLQTIDGTPA